MFKSSFAVDFIKNRRLCQHPWNVNHQQLPTNLEQQQQLHKQLAKPQWWGHTLTRTRRHRCSFSCYLEIKLLCFRLLFHVFNSKLCSTCSIWTVLYWVMHIFFIVVIIQGHEHMIAVATNGCLKTPRLTAEMTTTCNHHGWLKQKNPNWQSSLIIKQLPPINSLRPIFPLHPDCSSSEQLP